MASASISLTLILVGITIVVSYLAFQNRSLHSKLAHIPFLEARNSSEYYRMLSSGFVHGGGVHLGINMFVLWQFGEVVERLFGDLFGEGQGRLNYLLLYLFSVIFANLATFIKHRDNSSFASVGASGAVSAILFSYLIFAPWRNIYLYGVLPIPTIVAAVAYVGYSSWASKNRRDHIDHDAHLYGAIFGFLFTIVLKPSLFGLFFERLMMGPQF
mgnify:CR=1 FL=1